MRIYIIMRRGGRSKRSSRESSRQTIPDRDAGRQTISRPPDYNPRQPVNRPPSAFRFLSGSAPMYKHGSIGRTPKTTDMKEESDESAD